MYYYIETEENEENYIMNYRKENNNIIVETADGQKHKLEQNDELEKQIQTKMISQAIQAVNIYKTGEILEYNDISSKILMFSTSMFILDLACLTQSAIANNNEIIIGIGLGITSVISYKALKEKTITNDTIKELYALSVYLDNKEQLNNVTKKEIEEIIGKKML